MLDDLGIPFDNSYVAELEGTFVPWKGEDFPDPKVLCLNDQLAVELGLDISMLKSPDGAAMLSGKALPDNAASIAMAYAGHQFGGFSPQLGDGRALLVGELIDIHGARRDLHLKGSGRTPFSRGGDGKAVLGPVLREYLMGEAMHALGVPTTRALAATVTGETVYREGPEQGAVLARVAASHLRVGTFQFFAARKDTDQVRNLADYAIRRHFPDIEDVPNKYLEFFRAVSQAQANLVAQWVSLGFVHGVMNTDNMTISGETIDYGPCAFIDHYDPKAVYSSIDQGGRYAFGNQPVIAQWNLSRFAETLITLINPDDEDDAIRQLTNEVNAFPAMYQSAWLKAMRAKFGMLESQSDDLALVNDLHQAMEGQKVDYTKMFRSLSDVLRGDDDAVSALFAAPEAIQPWLARFHERHAVETGDKDLRADEMDRINPIYIPRNHMVEAALKAASKGEMTAFDELVSVLRDPFVNRPGAMIYAEPAPDGFGPYKTFCGT